MQNDFTPIHLKQANAALDKHSLAPKKDQEYHNPDKHKSLWQKLLGLFKTSPFELPDDLYKHK